MKGYALFTPQNDLLVNEIMSIREDLEIKQIKDVGLTTWNQMLEDGYTIRRIIIKEARKGE